MGRRELLDRSRQYVTARIDILRYRAGLDFPVEVTNAASEGHFFFTAADVHTTLLAEGVLATFPIGDRIAVRVLLTDTIRRKLLTLLADPGAALPDAAAAAATPGPAAPPT